MKLVMTLLVRDEEDVIEANLRYHHDAGVDFFIITDNNSTDGTPAILQRWADRGLAHIIHEPQDDYAQAEWVTRMARLAATNFGADWVINADADEFFWPQRGTLKECLERGAPGVGAFAVPRVNFLPSQQSEELAKQGIPFWRSMQVRDVMSLSPVGAPLPPKMVHRAAADITVEQGNHVVRHPDRIFGQQTSPRNSPILILHFPQRSYAQFENKIRLGGAAYERNTKLDKSVGITWRHLYEMYKAGALPERYAQDVLNDEDIEPNIAAGKMIIDRRLSIRLDELMSTKQESSAAKNPKGHWNWDLDDAPATKRLEDLAPDARARVEAGLAEKRHQREQMAEDITLLTTDVDDSPIALNVLDATHQEDLVSTPVKAVVADYHEVLQFEYMLQQWAQAFTADDPLVLAIHAPGVSDESIQTQLVPLVERFGLDSDQAAEIVVDATPHGVMDSVANYEFIGQYRPGATLTKIEGIEELSLSVSYTPAKREVMRQWLLSEGLDEEYDEIPSCEAVSPVVDQSDIVARAMQVTGHLTQRECALLVDLAAEIAQLPAAQERQRMIVEVGSYQGRSTVALALASGDKVPVYAIDPHEPFVGEHGGQFGPGDRVAFFKHMLEHGIVERVRLLNLGSVDVAEGFPYDVDFLWLDGDHSDAAVEADFQAWDRHLASGALVAFHDCVDERIGPGRVAREAVESGRYEHLRRVDKIVVLRYIAN